MQFEKPPLLELTAEVKWLSAPQSPWLQPTNPSDQGALVASLAAHEDFFRRLIAAAAASGWTATERLVAQGQMLLSYQPIVRIRSSQEKDSRVIYQAGAGVFSAHALAPYKNWESFRPFAERGLGYLMQARVGDDSKKEFFGIVLRYLDLFTPDVIGDVSAGGFLRDILGFKLEIPKVLSDQIATGKTVEPRQITLQLPLDSGLEMQMTIAGNAQVGDRTGIIMDIVVSSPRSVPAEINEVMAVWDRAHSAIHHTFVGLTEKIHERMRPINENSDESI
jgi:uncharacterized protein (TIGR04255 family)